MGFARQSRLRTTCSAVQKNYHSAAFSGGGGGGGGNWGSGSGCDLLLPRGRSVTWQRSGRCPRHQQLLQRTSAGQWFLR